MFIYVITNSVSGKRYVGKTTKALSERWKWHVTTSRSSDVPLARAIRKYGTESFTIENLEECSNLKLLSERERYWIRELNTFRGKGYNATEGGDGVHGYRHTEDAKRRMSEARLGEKNHNFGKAWGKLSWSVEERRRMSEARTGELNPMFGQHHSFDAREKISKSQQKSVVQLDAQGEIVATYSSMKEAAAVGAPPPGISRVCRGLRKHCRGFGWAYLNSENRV